MTIHFEITSTDGDDSTTGATITIDGEVYTSGPSNKNWEAISTGLLLGKFKGRENELRLLVAPGLALDGELSRLSDRVAYRNGRMLFDGDPMHGSLAALIEKMINEAGSVVTTDGSEPVFMPFVRFAENLMTNPSQDSREHLFHFIEANGITITQDGHFLAYKGVDADRTSKHSGYGIVNGVEYQNAKLPNPDGAVVEIPRSMVNTNRGTACSVGLHAGDYSYADDFKGGGVLLNVKINPRDVVSVPSDNQDRKIRVARYVVLGENKGQVKKAVYQEEKPKETIQEVVAEAIKADQAEVKQAVADDLVEADVTTDHQKRVQKMVQYITGLPADTNLRRVRNRTITAKNRIPFDEAMAVLKRTYDS